MTTIHVDLNDELLALLHQSNRPADQTARELIVLELYRRGTLSSGKAAQVLGMSRQGFIEHASRLGIALLDMTRDEWEAERARSQAL